MQVIIQINFEWIFFNPAWSGVLSDPELLSQGFPIYPLDDSDPDILEVWIRPAIAFSTLIFNEYSIDKYDTLSRRVKRGRTIRDR